MSGTHWPEARDMMRLLEKNLKYIPTHFCLVLLEPCALGCIAWQDKKNLQSSGNHRD